MPMPVRSLTGAALAALVTLATITATLLAVTLAAKPAWAHARLLATDPAEGAVVSQSPARITLTFNEMVNQRFSAVVVTGADGQSYGDGAPRSVDQHLSQAVKPLPAGAVRVVWRTVSADGHPIEGAFTFAVTAPRPSTVDSPGPERPDGRPTSTGVLLGVAALAVPIAATAYLLLHRRRRRSADEQLDQPDAAVQHQERE